MGLERTHRTSIEQFLFLAIFIILFLFLGSLLAKERRVSKEQVLHHQLVQIRQGINLFNMVEKRYPLNLVELAIQSYQMPDSDRKSRYLQIVNLDELGRVIDPFGNPYLYDRDTGSVRSTTYPYMEW